MQNVGATVISQYADSPAINALINSINAALDPAANIDAFFAQMFNPATAVGYGLDCIGRIVGVSRVITVSSGTYFGLTGPTGDPAPGYSGLPFNQAPFYSGGVTSSNFALTDNAFRTLIYAKMLANISNNSVPSINNILMTLFGKATFSFTCFEVNQITIPAVDSGFICTGAKFVLDEIYTITIGTQISGTPNGIGTYNATGVSFGNNGTVTATSNCYVTDGQNQTMEYYFGFTPTPLQLSIINNSGVLPRPSGVAATVVHT